MLLRRIGNKSRIAKKIQEYFPPHRVYIEPFFGAGGMFFNKPKAKYNILNDIDSDVFNLFQVVSNSPKELEASFLAMPICEDLWRYWKKNQETDPIKRALRFLFFSNFGYMGYSETMRFLNGNSSQILYDNIAKTNEHIFGCEFSNVDFRCLFKKIPFRNNIDKVFIYCDPPYLKTNNNYSCSFVEQDALDLLDCLQGVGCKFAYSEFDNPFMLNQAKDRGLNVITIGERRNLKNRRIEILITNYDV